MRANSPDATSAATLSQDTLLVLGSVNGVGHTPKMTDQPGRYFYADALRRAAARVQAGDPIRGALIHQWEGGTDISDNRNSDG